MPKKLYKDIPADYPVCLYADCPHAASCLHQLVYQPLLEKLGILSLLNPQKCTKDKSCPYFRDAKPVSYARGFIGMQKRMFPGQYSRFMSILIGHFGRNAYFERRRGETALSPKEQKYVLKVLQDIGVTEKLEFDSYEENINWCD